MTICIAVLGGASTAPVESAILDEAIKLGRGLASAHVHLLTSGTGHGVIGRVLDGQRGFQNPRTSAVVVGSGEEQSVHPEAGSIVLVPSVSARKSFFLAQAKHLIALPGGLGTHDEILTFLVERKNVRTTQRLLLVNVNDYYSPLLTLISNMIATGFVKQKHVAGLEVVGDADGATKSATGH